MPFPDTPSRFLIHYVGSRPLSFLALAGIVVAASGCAVGVQFAMKLMIDAMTAPEHVVMAVYGALGLFVGLVATENLLSRLSGALLCRTTIDLGVKIRLDLFAYLAGHQMPFFQNQRAGSLGHRVTAMAGSFGAIINRMMLDVAPPLISFVGAVIIFAPISAPMAAVLAVCFVAVTGVLIVLGRRGHVHHREYARQGGLAGGELVDVIGNIWAVKSFAARPREVRRLRGSFETEAAAQRRGWMFVERIRILHDGALVLLVGGTLFWAVQLWSRGAVTAGDVVIVSALTFRILFGSRDLAMALVDVAQQFSYLEETLDLIGRPQGIVDAADARTLANGTGAISFQDVTFGYDPHRPVLKDVSIDVPAGQKVGIVGASGAGKSTMLQLMQRLYDVQAGRVLVNGEPVDEITQDSLHESIAVVPQEVLLFHRSVIENIRFARPDASDEEVFAAAHAAGCDGFIREMADGYASIVGERGTNLSGGQRQRIGIARAFLKDAPIVLLDEATSALDTRSELEVQRALVELMRDRTVLAVAHRLSTVVGFDRILVVEGGRIVEDGPPAHLLAAGGQFDRLWRLQVEGFASAPSAEAVDDEVADREPVAAARRIRPTQRRHPRIPPLKRRQGERLSS